MNLFRLNIKDNGESRILQICDVIAAYSGENTLEEIADNAGCGELHKALGELATSNGWYDKKNIHGVLAFEDNMGFFVDGYYFDNGKLINMERVMTNPNFELAVELNKVYHTIDPTNENNTISGCLSLLESDPLYVINGLVEELKD